MNPKLKNDSLTAKADAAFRQAASKVVRRAKQTDTPVVVWEEGHVKEVPADQLEVGEWEVESGE
jgi:hypothetical protein